MAVLAFHAAMGMVVILRGRIAVEDVVARIVLELDELALPTRDFAHEIQSRPLEDAPALQVLPARALHGEQRRQRGAIRAVPDAKRRSHGVFAAHGFFAAQGFFAAHGLAARRAPWRGEQGEHGAAMAAGPASAALRSPAESRALAAGFISILVIALSRVER